MLEYKRNLKEKLFAWAILEGDSKKFKKGKIDVDAIREFMKNSEIGESLALPTRGEGSACLYYTYNEAPCLQENGEFNEELEDHYWSDINVVINCGGGTFMFLDQMTMVQFMYIDGTMYATIA
ncbi:hypothetical protein IK110_03425 [Candidatus Saccharibacteria bacterium]|nr:hypothetical protein [Candidatus Saccharibacteria bacterium]